MKNLLINRALAAKKKKLFSLFLALVAGAGIMFASDIQVDGIWYNFNSRTKTASVTYQGKHCYYYLDEYLGIVVIPASVTYNGTTYSVTSIGESAFNGCNGLTSVTIPNSVTSIGEDAFRNCSSLTSVTIDSDAIVNKAYTSSSNIKNIFGSQVKQYIIGNSVTSIGDYAFCEVRLSSVTIGNSVTSIGYLAFFGNGMRSITIPNSVTSIGAYAFDGCTYLTSVTIEAETPPVLSKYVFDGADDWPIYVPCNAVNAYKSAPSWNPYADRIRGNCAYYTITFKNWDGCVLQSTQVEEGQMPQYTGATPTKPDDAQYTYTFSGWTPQIVAATADATYTATYTDTPRNQGVEDVLSDQVQSTKVVKDGQVLILRNGKTYTMQGQEVK